MSFNLANRCTSIDVQRLLISSIGKYVDWACANAFKRGTITVSGFGYFHKNCRFLWGKNVLKTNLGSTIHYTYMSYNKYFRLCMVSEELRLNEIGLFLQQYRRYINVDIILWVYVYSNLIIYTCICIFTIIKIFLSLQRFTRICLFCLWSHLKSICF